LYRAGITVKGGGREKLRHWERISLVGMAPEDPGSVLGCLFLSANLMIRIPSPPNPFYSAPALQDEARTMEDASWWGDWEFLEWM
jgi:hypothetical protein